ncbi:protein phosphatase 1 regulatory subunit 32 [Periophthalmus magnuspinnatus]|uniref:protein phosphatase 1 regulatory subunit 32 n=1 Tax=Periophthalmus magnuspinnatus TaxID=409849 RepID=UPI00243675FD|nr:protein phosphatase 1 regulatory subunit 32 [Periophthalmus magnuspinnatus]
MAEQRSTSSVGATGSRGRITSSTLHTPNHTSDGKRYRPGESGFTNNQRLVLGYRPPLDLIDNPQYGSLLFDNYITQTKWHYQPYVYNDGSGSKPSLFYKRESGFFQLNVPPKPLCQNEKSEYQSLYVTHPLVPTEKIINIGLKGDSGFTKGEDLQINTFTNKTCTPFEARYTHNTVMKTDFQAPSHLQGSKVIPNLRSHACRETGYTRGTNAPLACPSSLLPSPWRTQAPSLLKTTGKKEPSGFLHNAPNHRTFPLTPQHSSHFLTHYDNVFGPVSGLRANVSSTGVILHNKLKTSYNQRDTDRLIFRDSTFI